MSYNRSEYLREAVQSVLAQTIRPESIVIYDNGSDKGVFESVEEFLCSEVKWLGTDANHSFLWNFNRAMLNGDSRYVMMLHDDDRLCPNFLEEQIALLESDNKFLAVSCNGYYIDAAGARNGDTLALVPDNAQVELYEYSGQIALKYASNSCIPFSPTIYRRQLASVVKFREEFAKVLDAVYFCDIADIGSIAYQTKPLYECRAHSGQDSNYFPYDLMNQLENFFWSRKCLTDVENAHLQSLLLTQHTTRNIKQFVQAVKNMDLSLAQSLLLDERFITTAAIRVAGTYGWKHIIQKL
jgi:glycosyltransferase involved in cell wall biosynthesis